MNIFVGNLSYDTRDSDLENLFAGYGTVDSCRVIMDRDTRRSKGFGFVEMGDDSEAQMAITELDGTSLHDRTIKVNEARPRESNFRR